MGQTEGGSVDQGAVGNDGPVGHGRSRSVGGGSGVGDLGDVAAVAVGVVGDGLDPAVGQGHGVGAGGGVAVAVLVLDQPAI